MAWYKDPAQGQDYLLARRVALGQQMGDRDKERATGYKQWAYIVKTIRAQQTRVVHM